MQFQFLPTVKLRAIQDLKFLNLTSTGPNLVFPFNATKQLVGQQQQISKISKTTTNNKSINYLSDF